jgi:hypothetical protein
MNSIHTYLNESEISGMKLDMLGKKLLPKIKIGSEFHTDDNVYTVTEYGPKANAFQEYIVTDSSGKELKAKLTVMYGVKFEIQEDVRIGMHNAKEVNLNKITL